LIALGGYDGTRNIIIVGGLCRQAYVRLKNVCEWLLVLHLEELLSVYDSRFVCYTTKGWPYTVTTKMVQVQECAEHSSRIIVLQGNDVMSFNLSSSAMDWQLSLYSYIRALARTSQSSFP
jgi:hypothetical protein